ncbi:MAG: hypothetical protein GAK43_01408 [Stenotrophomonas maltophilia]|nr:MAG: hypothetical protein GAK43_01408 [Stenotrophomonas maltophilia]
MNDLHRFAIRYELHEEPRSLIHEAFEQPNEFIALIQVMLHLAHETGEDVSGLSDAPWEPNQVPSLQRSADLAGVSKVKIVALD